MNAKEQLELEILRKNGSRKWKLVKFFVILGTLLTVNVSVMMYVNSDALAKTVAIWTLVIPILFGAGTAYVGIKTHHDGKQGKD